MRAIARPCSLHAQSGFVTRTGTTIEWAQSDIQYVSATLSLRPSGRLRIDGSFDFQDYWRRRDHILTGRTYIPRVKVEYQVTPAVFVRVVGEVDGLAA